jgi:hypothetical protein
LVEQNETHLKEFGRNVSSIEYFTKELNKSIELRDKIQTALYTEAKELDEAIEYVRNFKAEQYDKERDILKNVIDEEIEPEYDSAGFTEDDRIVNGQYRVISNEDADEDAKQRDYSAFKNYADTLTQDEQRYADSMINAKAEDRKLNNL